MEAYQISDHCYEVKAKGGMQTSEKLKTNETNKEEGCVWPQILAISAASLGALNDGALYAWTSPFLVKLVNDKEHYDISEMEANNITVVMPLTMVLTGYLFSQLVDRIGRKKTMFLIAVPQILSLLTCAFARSIYVFYISRVFAGLGSAILMSALPAYIGEVTSPRVRGVWGNSLTSMFYVGQFFVNVAGSYCDILTVSCIFTSVSVLFSVVYYFMPESPFFFIMKGDNESAKQSLRYLTRKTNVDEDFSMLKMDVDRQMSEAGNWKDLFCINSNRRALIIAMGKGMAWEIKLLACLLIIAIFLRISQMFGGCGILVQYNQYIIKKAGEDVSPEIVSILFTGLCVVFNILAVSFIVNRFSRKVLFATSSALCSIVLCVFASYFYCEEFVPNVDLDYVSWLPLTCCIIFLVGWSYGLAIIPTLMIGELFSVSVKSKAMILMMVALGGGASLSNLLFNILNNAFGTFAPFVFFALYNIGTLTVSLYVIPETKGKTLEEIQMVLKGYSEDNIKNNIKSSVVN
uniref:Facilitated trehalose transporter Tret1-2 homolog n=1 Tax=Diabrotica virgifera virgifera TaxID=50390 RepID=A0A6P7GMZ6_DIAVI